MGQRIIPSGGKGTVLGMKGKGDMTTGMDGIYEMEELLPVLAWLTDKYTSKESSSVPYEAAGVLMEAVMYCIRESLAGDDETILPAARKLPAMEMYQRGYQMVLDKVYRAKEIYEEIIRDFTDYGCRNYGDTILKGMPAFFLKYDPRFRPQDELLTLDYPLITRNPDLCGVNLILEYLEGIRIEKRLLDSFSPQVVRKLLEREMPEYRELYLDNICNPVVLCITQCFITGRPVSELNMESLSSTEEGDVDMIREFFRGDDLDQAELKISRMLHQIMKQEPDMASYFVKASRDYAVRIMLRISL